jgi:hypothetical protein
LYVYRRGNFGNRVAAETIKPWAVMTSLRPGEGLRMVGVFPMLAKKNDATHMYTLTHTYYIYIMPNNIV